MENDRGPPDPKSDAEEFMRDFADMFLLGGRVQYCELGRLIDTQRFIQRWGVKRMPSGKYRAIVIYHIGSPDLPSLNAMEGERDYVRSWLNYAGLPVIRFSDSTPSVLPVEMQPPPKPE